MNEVFSKTTILTLILISLMGCSNLKKETPSSSLNKTYAIAQKNLRHKDWKKAITKLETLGNYYPFGPCSQQIQLDLIYAYFKNDDLSLAQLTIDRFIRLNPTHPNIDYVIYMRGLTSIALDNNTLQRLFGIDRFDRDPRHARNAFNDLSKLVRNYPNSQYANDAIKHLIFLKNRLAKHEYSIAKYYTRCGAWVAVVNRIEGMLRDYPDTRATRDGLKLMENAYRHMQMITQANKVLKIIFANSDN